MNYDGTGKTQKTNWQAAGKQASFFFFDKNRTKIVYEKGEPSNAFSHEIYSANIDFSGELRITNNTNNDGRPSWSPDGTKIVWNEEVSPFSGTFNLWIANANGTNPVQITTAASGKAYLNPLFSPDGSKIICTYNNGTQSDIYVMNLDGTSQQNITNTSGFDESASQAYARIISEVKELNRDGIVQRYTLNQNYPNPFNPTTTIEFSLPKSSQAMLKIFDILGREVATLVNEHLNAGTFKTEWDAKNMPSGTYFYRLQAGDASTGSAQSFVETKKLLLLR
jgi:dipeptidyl aminopeptidase/acylaminoacyl peptidase